MENIWSMFTAGIPASRRVRTHSAGFGAVEGGGVGFRRDLVGRVEVEDLARPAEELAEVGGGEHQRRAAAVIEGAGLSGRLPTYWRAPSNRASMNEAAGVSPGVCL